MWGAKIQIQSFKYIKALPKMKQYLKICPKNTDQMSVDVFNLC